MSNGTQDFENGIRKLLSRAYDPPEASLEFRDRLLWQLRAKQRGIASTRRLSTK